MFHLKMVWNKGNLMPKADVRKSTEYRFNPLSVWSDKVLWEPQFKIIKMYLEVKKEQIKLY